VMSVCLQSVYEWGVCFKMLSPIRVLNINLYYVVTVILGAVSLGYLYVLLVRRSVSVFLYCDVVIGGAVEWGYDIGAWLWVVLSVGIAKCRKILWITSIVKCVRLLWRIPCQGG